MSYIWIKQIKKFIQILMTKINSILKSRKDEIIFIIKLLAPKLSIININISYDIKTIIIYIILDYILLTIRKKK